MLIETLAALVILFVAVAFLLRVPGFNYGWMHLFAERGGNVFVTPLGTGMKSDIGWVRLLPVLFIGALIFVMPFIVHMEEKIFRHHVVAWPRIIRRSLVFGPIHCIAGVPIAAGIALIISGLFYGYQYRRSFYRSVGQLGFVGAHDEALMASTAYHTMWNTLVCGILFVAALVAAVVPQ